MLGKTVLQLGYGMQGKASLSDMLQNAAVDKIIIADISSEIDDLPQKLGDKRVSPVHLEANDEHAVCRLMEQADVVIELMPGPLAFPIARLACKVGTNLVTSMYLSDPGETDPVKKDRRREDIALLDESARRQGITILEEFGMDPGMDLILAWKAINEMDRVKAFFSYGAGFPEPAASRNPLRYKFTWSVIGVIRSYLRPAKVIRDGHPVVIPQDAMFSRENIHHLKLSDFEEPLECCPNGDSTHYAALFGIDDVEAMGRYICRWPGTSAFWEVMAKSGYLSSQPISVAGTEVSPEAFCSALLGEQEQFRYAKDERDVALIRSDVRGYKDGKALRKILQIIDYRDLNSGFTAMQRTVGYPMSIGAQMIMDGTLTDKGVVSPIQVPFMRYMAELEKRGLHFTTRTEEWDGNYDPAK